MSMREMLSDTEEPISGMDSSGPGPPGGLVRSGLASSLTGVCRDDQAKLQEKSRETLPRTLSTSALRIRNRISFWDKFWQDRRQTDS